MNLHSFSVYLLPKYSSETNCPSLNDADRLSQTQLIKRLTHNCRYDRLERPRSECYSVVVRLRHLFIKTKILISISSRLCSCECKRRTTTDCCMGPSLHLFHAKFGSARFGKFLLFGSRSDDSREFKFDFPFAAIQNSRIDSAAFRGSTSGFP